MVGLASVPMLFMVFVSAYVFINSAEIKEKLIAEISSSTGGNIRIHGKVDFALFRHLPNVALELQSVEISGTDSTSTPFVKAERIYLLANFWDVVRGNWNIQATSIEDGEVAMLKTRDGVINYRFAKTDASVDSAGSDAIGIEKAILKNIGFRLNDEMNDVNISLRVDDASVRGNFSTKNLLLKTVGNAYSHHVQIKQVDYAHEREINFDGSLSVLPESESYMLAVRKFIVENNEFEVNGSINVVNNAPEFDLTVRGKDISIQDLPMLLPVQYSSKLNGIKGTGKVQLSSEIKGRLDEKVSPLITIAASASGATMKIPGMENRIEDLTFKGTFTNGAQHSFATSSLVFQSLTAKTREGVLDAVFSISDLNNPQLQANAHGTVDLSMFNRFLPDSGSVREMKGLLEFKNLKYNGKAGSVISGKFYGMEGSVSMQNVEVKIDTLPISIAEAHIEAYEKSLSIWKLDMQLPGSKFFVTGSIMHMPGLSKTYNVPVVNLTVKADRVNVEDILALANSGTDVPDAGQKSNSLSFGANGFIRLNSNYIGWGKFKAYDASCTLALTDNIAEIKNFSCNTMDGTLDFDSKIVKYANGMATTTTAQGSNININEMFFQLNDFNQHTITSKNVAGKLEFKADVKADFADGALDESSLVSSSKLTISEGQLIDFKPLEGLSNFIDIEELRGIKFSTLSNTITISQKVVTIPEMLIRSSAMTLSLSGQQTFSGLIDYHVKVNIFNLLGKRFRKKKNVEEYEEVGEDDFNFYLSMKGTADEPIIKHEKQGVRNRVVHQKENFQLLEEMEEDPADTGNTDAKERIVLSNKKKVKEPEEDLEYIDWEDE